MNELQEVFQHFLQKLMETPLLLGWLLVGPVIALITNGWLGLAFGLINVFLIGAYAIFIYRMTPNAPLPTRVKHPHLEFALALILFGMFLLIQLLDFDVWTIQPWYSWVHGFFMTVYRDMEFLDRLPDWARNDMYSAVSSTIKQLIPTLFVFILLRYRRGDMGFTHPHWGLTMLLVGITAVFGLITGILFSASFLQILVMYLIGIFLNALPEELYFRGFLLPRLERLFAHPLNALVVSAILFNVIHVPVEIYHGATPLLALINVFSIGYPSGLIWGYLYLRTRSIIPSMFWHASNGILGFIMMSL